MQRIPLRLIRPPNNVRTLRFFSSLTRPTYGVARQPSYLLQPRSLRSYTANTRSSQPADPHSFAPVADETKLSLSERFKVLFKKYRWPTLIVYFGLSVVDFGISFLVVRAFGTEKIGRYEKIILRKVEDVTGWKAKGTPPQKLEEGQEAVSIWTEVALAYTIHKTLFALIRIPVAVAITPPLVKWYHRRGYGAALAQLPAIGRLFQTGPAVAARKST